MLAVERWQGLPPHAGQNLASAPGPASRRRQWCARMTETLESCRLQGVRQILDTISIATLLLAACRPDRRRSLTFEARNMPERVGEEGSRRVPRQVFKVSTPPSHPRTPAGDTTEHGKMGRKLLMLSATPNCSPAEPEYIYTEIRPYAAGRRLAAHAAQGGLGAVTTGDARSNFHQSKSLEGQRLVHQRERAERRAQNFGRLQTRVAGGKPVSWPVPRPDIALFHVRLATSKASPCRTWKSTRRTLSTILWGLGGGGVSSLDLWLSSLCTVGTDLVFDPSHLPGSNPRTGGGSQLTETRLGVQRVSGLFAPGGVDDRWQIETGVRALERSNGSLMQAEHHPPLVGGGSDLKHDWSRLRQAGPKSATTRNGNSRALRRRRDLDLCAILGDPASAAKARTGSRPLILSISRPLASGGVPSTRCEDPPGPPFLAREDRRAGRWTRLSPGRRRCQDWIAELPPESAREGIASRGSAGSNPNNSDAQLADQSFSRFQHGIAAVTFVIGSLILRDFAQELSCRIHGGHAKGNSGGEVSLAPWLGHLFCHTGLVSPRLELNDASQSRCSRAAQLTLGMEMAQDRSELVTSMSPSPRGPSSQSTMPPPLPHAAAPGREDHFRQPLRWEAGEVAARVCQACGQSRRSMTRPGGDDPLPLAWHPVQSR